METWASPRARFRAPGKELFPVNVACQSVNVSPESRTVPEQAVEPVQMVAGDAYHPSHVIHGKERAHSDDVPLPLPEEEEAEHNAEQHERDVDRNLDLREFDAHYLAEGHGKPSPGMVTLPHLTSSEIPAARMVHPASCDTAFSHIATGCSQERK